MRAGRRIRIQQQQQQGKASQQFPYIIRLKFRKLKPQVVKKEKERLYFGGRGAVQKPRDVLEKRRGEGRGLRWRNLQSHGGGECLRVLGIAFSK